MISENPSSRLVSELRRRAVSSLTKEKRITAYHEAGHAIPFPSASGCGTCIHSFDPSLQEQAQQAYTMPLPEKDEMFNTKGLMLQEIVVDIGGRVAEELVFDVITTVHHRTSSRLQSLRARWLPNTGMSDNIGLICYADDEEEVFIGRDLAHAKNYSEA